MFDIGILELFIVAVIALLVLGPERLPRAAQQAGRLIGRGKRMMDQWSSEVNRQIENEALIKTLKESAALEELDSDINAINKSISHALSGSPIGDQSCVSPDKTASNSTTVAKSSAISNETNTVKDPKPKGNRLSASA